MKKIRLNEREKGMFLIAGALLLVVLAYGYRCGLQKSCGSSAIEHVVRGGKVITFPQGKVYAEVADTAASREQGLSGRKGLSDDEGMLFVFDTPGRYGFWMKDMLFSIDMVWINQDGVVVHLERNVSPDTYFKFNPPATFINGPEAKYVLELASGASEKYGVYLGTKVKIGE
jgi:uncharacterized membrane protein (UPF0127 family)